MSPSSPARRTFLALPTFNLAIAAVALVLIVPPVANQLHKDEKPSPEFKLPETFDRSKAEKGEAIAGWIVTSGFGPRNVKGCATCSTMHRGVDVGTPIGTPVRAIGAPDEEVVVECKFDRNGTGGIYTVQRSRLFPNLSFESLHLSKCYPGKAKAGAVIGLTGTAGTGPHLHFQVRDETKRGDRFKGLYSPEAGFVKWVLTGKP